MKSKFFTTIVIFFFTFAAFNAVGANNIESEIKVLKKEQKRQLINAILEAKDICNKDKKCIKKVIKSFFLERISLQREGKKMCTHQKNTARKQCILQYVIDNQPPIEVPEIDHKNKIVILTDSSCGVCVDVLSSAPVLFLKQNFTEQDIVILDISKNETSQEANIFISENNVTSVPSIFVSNTFVEQHKPIIREFSKSGLINLSQKPLNYEIFTFGNKRVIDISKMPPIPEDDTIVIQQFIDPFCAECLRFVHEEYPQIKEKHGVGINTLVTASGGEPAMFASEAAVCAYQSALNNNDVDAGFEAYFKAIEEIQSNQEKYTEALRSALKTNKISEREEILRTTLNEIVSADIASCLEAHEGLPMVGAQIQLAQQIGVVGTPAYFVGDRFLAGPQTTESIERAIKDYENAMKH